MASLGMLTAGIAHEIKNPLNFINSFALLSVELAGELKDILESVKGRLLPDAREKTDEILNILQSNAANIHEEGLRADGIIRSMLIHSHGCPGLPQETDVNDLLGEAVNLAIHSMRSKDTYFDIRIEGDYDPTIGLVQVIPQDMCRVFINLINNAYDATRKKRESSGDDYVPRLDVRTRNLTGHIDIRIRDNGTGIPDELVPEIFNPFVTTKPTGERTGLGLSISYNIIQGHQGSIDVNTKEGEYAEFVIRLPKRGVKRET